MRETRDPDGDETDCGCVLPCLRGEPARSLTDTPERRPDYRTEDHGTYRDRQDRVDDAVVVNAVHPVGENEVDVRQHAEPESASDDQHCGLAMVDECQTGASQNSAMPRWPGMSTIGEDKRLRTEYLHGQLTLDATDGRSNESFPQDRRADGTTAGDGGPEKGETEPRRERVDGGKEPRCGFRHRGRSRAHPT